MNKLYKAGFLLLCILTIALSVVGCAYVCEYLGIDEETAKEQAVELTLDKVSTELISKIEASENLTAEGKEKLKAKVLELKEDIKVEINKNKVETATEDEAVQ